MYSYESDPNMLAFAAFLFKLVLFALDYRTLALKAPVLRMRG
jgi:hypothetical protein